MIIFLFLRTAENIERSNSKVMIIKGEALIKSFILFNQQKNEKCEDADEKE